MVLTILKNMSSSMGRIIPYIVLWKIKKCFKPPTSTYKMTDILGVFHGINHQPYDSCRKSDTSSGRIFSLGGQLSAPRTQQPTIRIFAAALVWPVGLGFSAQKLPFIGCQKS